jgi:hypothetical protein
MLYLPRNWGLDGEDCFWGGDDYDGIISKIYDIPVYSFSFKMDSVV